MDWHLFLTCGALILDSIGIAITKTGNEKHGFKVMVGCTICYFSGAITGYVLWGG